MDKNYEYLIFCLLDSGFVYIDKTKSWLKNDLAIEHKFVKTKNTHIIVETIDMVNKNSFISSLEVKRHLLRKVEELSKKTHKRVSKVENDRDTYYDNLVKGCYGMGKHR